MNARIGKEKGEGERREYLFAVAAGAFYAIFRRNLAARLFWSTLYPPPPPRHHQSSGSHCAACIADTYWR